MLNPQISVSVKLIPESYQHVLGAFGLGNVHSDILWWGRGWQHFLGLCVLVAVLWSLFGFGLYFVFHMAYGTSSSTLRSCDTPRCLCSPTFCWCFSSPGASPAIFWVPWLTCYRSKDAQRKPKGGSKKLKEMQEKETIRCKPDFEEEGQRQTQIHKRNRKAA